MDELLARAMQGVDPGAPDAFVRIFTNLLALVPWVALFWWNASFVVVGALLGWWRGRTVEGLAWAALLGPIGWIVILCRRAPDAPARRGSRGPKPPPLPR